MATACDCDEALVEAHNHKPDLITLDMRMPRKSGIRLLRKLKADRAFRDMRPLSW